jgi:hypothetical protein
MPTARVGEVAVLARLLGALDPLGGFGRVDELVTALADALERRRGGHVIDPALQIAAPVVGLHAVQRRDHIVERIGQLAIVAVAHAKECLGEIVDRTLPPGLLADDPVDVDPDQLAFTVIILAALPAAPWHRRSAGRGRVIRGVDQRAPRPARRPGAVGRCGRSYRIERILLG